MKYAEAMKMIKNGPLKSVYLLAGEEVYLAQQAERVLLSRLLPEGETEALQKISGDLEVEEVVQRIDAAPFFFAKNIILVRSNSLFKEKKSAAAAGGKSPVDKREERLLAAIANMPDYSVLILTTNEKPDKRRKLYKTIEKHGMVVETEAVQSWNIGEWLQGKLRDIGKQLDGEAYAYLTEAIGAMQQVSLGFLDHELDKLALYTEKPRISKADLLQVLSGLPEVSIFAMLDAVSDRNLPRALQLLEEQLAAGVYPLSIAALLTRHVRQLWQAKSLEAKGCKGRQLAAPLGLVPFIAEKVGQKSRGFSEASLRQAMLALADADYKLKSGQAEPALLERILIELCT